MLHATQPFLWLVCVASAILTWALCAAVPAVFGEAPPAGGWWQDPLGELARLGQTLFGHGTGVGLFRGLVLGVPLYIVWGILGVGLTRREALIRRLDGERVDFNWRRIPACTARKWRQSLGPVIVVVSFAGLICLPEILGGLLNRIPVVGPVLVAVLLPVFLVCSLALVVTSAGVVCHWLMPPALAFEGADAWDAVSRSYSYFYQAPFAFLWREALALAVSALPAAFCVWLLQVGLVLGVLALPLLLAGAGLSFSWFWALQARVYVALRCIVDGTEEDEMYLEEEEEVTAPVPATPAAPPKETGQKAGPATDAVTPAPASAPASSRPAMPFRLGPYLGTVVLACLAWLVTCDFITAWGGAEGRWMRWGLDGRLVPEVEGASWVASLIAAFWGLVAVGFVLLRPLVQALRQRG